MTVTIILFKLMVSIALNNIIIFVVYISEEQLQVAKVAIGSTVGGLLLLVILIAIGCIVVSVIWLQKCKHKTYTFNTNVAYNRRRVESTSQTNDYEDVTGGSTYTHSYSSVNYHGVCRSSIGKEFTFDQGMEQNEAYKQSELDIPTSINVAYVGVNESLNYSDTSDKVHYDYVLVDQ